MGKPVSNNELADIYLRLQSAGAENINLVTGTHFVPGIMEAAEIARDRGLSIPFVWNSSGFETEVTLKILDSFISVYLPDVKTVSTAFSTEMYSTPGYAEAAKAAVKRMIASRPVIWDRDRLKQGVIVRHMVLPGYTKVTREVLEWFSREAGDAALFSLMFQYTPVSSAGLLSRRINAAEYTTVLKWLDDCGIEEGFVQELEDDGDWLPDFRAPRPFPAGESKTIWHWNTVAGLDGLSHF